MKSERFTVICNDCGSRDCEVIPISPPYWDDDCLMLCNACGSDSDEPGLPVVTILHHVGGSLPPD